MKLRSSRPLTSLPVPEVRTGPLRPLTSSGSASLVRLERGADLGVEGGGENGHLLGGGELFCDGNRRVVALCNRNCFPFGGLFAWPSATEERTKARQRPAVIRQKRETRLDGKINKSRSADRRGTQELRMLAQRTASKDEAHAWVSRRQLRHKDGWTGCEWGENQRTAVAVPER